MDRVLNSRDHKIDWIRALCTLTVILAHVGSPDIVNHIRTFDVVALVMISGMSMSFASGKYLSYLWKRIKKILIPTYIVITVIFVLTFIACKALRTSQLYPADRMIKSYLLLYEGSMGYVWIVRIFLFIAILEPVIKKIAENIKSILLFAGTMVLFALAGFLLLRIYIRITEPVAAGLYNDFLYSPYVYSVVALTGYWFIRNKDKWLYQIIGAAVVFAASQVFMVIPGMGFVPNLCKYPPQFYYLSYGLLITLVLYKLFPDKDVKAVSWLSRNSFMIYLLHIVVLRVYGLASKISFFKFLEDKWIIEYIIVTACAVVLTLIVNFVKQKLFAGKKAK